MTSPTGFAPCRRGFTFVETMIATAVGAIVLVAVLSSFIAAQRMLHTAMAESELSLAMRELRDKLLFKASPDISGSHYAGLLSGVSLNEGDVRGYNSVEMSGHTVGSSLSSESTSSVRLLLWQVGDKKMLINERTPDKDAHVKWLWPGSLALAKWDDPESDVTVMSDILGFGSRNANGSNVYRLDFDICIAADVKRSDGSRIVRRERVSVPVLGKLQPIKNANGKY